MNQHIPQEQIRSIIISDMVKKRNSIVPVIGEDTIVYKDEGTGKEIPFQGTLTILTLGLYKKILPLSLGKCHNDFCSK